MNGLFLIVGVFLFLCIAPYIVAVLVSLLILIIQGFTILFAFMCISWPIFVLLGAAIFLTSLLVKSGKKLWRQRK